MKRRIAQVLLPLFLFSLCWNPFSFGEEQKKPWEDTEQNFPEEEALSLPEEQSIPPLPAQPRTPHVKRTLNTSEEDDEAELFQSDEPFLPFPTKKSIKIIPAKEKKVSPHPKKEEPIAEIKPYEAEIQVKKEAVLIPEPIPPKAEGQAKQVPLAEEGTLTFNETFKREESAQEYAFQFKAGPVSLPSFQGKDEEFQTAYGDKLGWWFLTHLEWLPIQFFGLFGPKIGAGFYFVDGDAKGDPTNYVHFLMIATEAGLSYHLAIWDDQWLVPFAEIGVGYYFLRQGSAKISTRGVDLGYQAYLPGYYLGAGIQLLMDSLDKRAAHSIDLDHGVNNSYFTIEYRRLSPTQKQDSLDFSSDIVLAGLLFDF